MGELQKCVCREREPGPEQHTGSLGEEGEGPSGRPGHHAQVISGINPSPSETFCVLSWASLYPMQIARGLWESSKYAWLTNASASGYTQSLLPVACILHSSERQLLVAKWSIFVFIQIENIEVRYFTIHLPNLAVTYTTFGFHWSPLSTVMNKDETV